MERYRGLTERDKIVNGGKFVVEQERGGEVWNFLPFRGFCYGFVESKSINLERLGGTSDKDCVDSVTVVFVATRPNGGRRVIGWYEDARVWHQLQSRVEKGVKKTYFARAETANCELLTTDQRVLAAPNSRSSGFRWGQNQVRYIDEHDENQEFVKRLRRFIADPRKNIPSSSKNPKGQRPDPEFKRRVESAAVQCVIEHYQDLGYTYYSVEKENKGWDLEFFQGDSTLLVEVKGRSSFNADVELTPNEYFAMSKKSIRFDYRLAIVTNALSNPTLSIVRFRGSDQTWLDQHGRTYEVEPRPGAKVSRK